MALNVELMAKVKAAESEYGSSDNWPESVVKELNGLANRQPDGSEETIEAQELFRRGFNGNKVAEKMHRSSHWAATRKPIITEFDCTNEDLKDLKRYEGKPIRWVATRMGRNYLWVRCMREKLREAE
ncbi:hypothetical protein GNY08_07065 [Levilactobacillus brevis]|uniref:hypothetical protein n=1 Tax=Levilactobacillus brevis TaxID=1580 RepID=UPI0018C0D257|nr:hypothetical protein [Levilactobacillus brevis]QOX67337.1 hypothetical protein GNY08_07065 [Levilactobacillus brevis]